MPAKSKRKSAAAIETATESAAAKRSGKRVKASPAATAAAGSDAISVSVPVRACVNYPNWDDCVCPLIAGGGLYIWIGSDAMSVVLSYCDKRVRDFAAKLTEVPAIEPLTHDFACELPPLPPSNAPANAVLAAPQPSPRASHPPWLNSIVTQLHMLHTLTADRTAASERTSAGAANVASRYVHRSAAWAGELIDAAHAVQSGIENARVCDRLIGALHEWLKHTHVPNSDDEDFAPGAAAATTANVPYYPLSGGGANDANRRKRTSQLVSKLSRLVRARARSGHVRLTSYRSSLVASVSNVQVPARGDAVFEWLRSGFRLQSVAPNHESELLGQFGQYIRVATKTIIELEVISGVPPIRITVSFSEKQKNPKYKPDPKRAKENADAKRSGSGAGAGGGGGGGGDDADATDAKESDVEDDYDPDEEEQENRPHLILDWWDPNGKPTHTATPPQLLPTEPAPGSWICLFHGEIGSLDNGDWSNDWNNDDDGIGSGTAELFDDWLAAGAALPADGAAPRKAANPLTPREWICVCVLAASCVDMCAYPNSQFMQQRIGTAELTRLMRRYDETVLEFGDLLVEGAETNMDEINRNFCLRHSQF